jgi:glutamate synthase (NADPH/NADH) small chain
LEFDRHDRGYKPAAERVKHWNEFVEPLPAAEVKTQAARCMDCGIPYCHNGCPVNNQIPDWNDLVYRDHWETAARNLHSTNNFPEITGRVCPAPVRGILHAQHRRQAGHRSRRSSARSPTRRSRKAGSHPTSPRRRPARRSRSSAQGPAGLAAAQQLARAGHEVHVYEKSAKPGGLLVYGIPDFKMEKHIVERRVKQMEAEGVVFHCNVHVGKTVSIKELEAGHDAVLLAGGSEKPFDFFEKSPGRDLDGLHFAMHFLPQQNRRVSGEPQRKEQQISAKGKHVVVIGGGDTGSDCIGTSFRQGAKSVTQLEIMPMPPEKENKALSWPHWPLKLRVSSSQAEGAKVEYAISTTGFAGKDGKVEKLLYTRVDKTLKPVPGSEGEMPADLVLFAMGLLRSRGGRRGQGDGSAGGAARPLQGPGCQRARLSRAPAQEGVRAGDIRRGPVAWWCGRSARAGRRRTPSIAS